MKSKEATRWSVAELCEAYIKMRIRADFGESSDRLSRGLRIADPESTLEAMSKTDRLPSKYIGSGLDPGISHLLDTLQLRGRRLKDEQLVPMLEEYAEQLSLDQVPPDTRRFFERYEALHQAVAQVLTHESRRSYLDEWGHPVFVYLRADGMHLSVSFDNEGQRIGQLSDKTVHSILIGTWRFGNTRRHEARRFICDELKALIAGSRERAECSLAEAVAISSDASEIFRADHVIVFEGTPHEPQAVAFDASAFATMKIIAPAKKGFPRKKMKRPAESMLTGDTVAPIIVQLLSEEQTRASFSLGDKTILCCHRIVCTCAPDGGVRLL